MPSLVAWHLSSDRHPAERATWRVRYRPCGIRSNRTLARSMQTASRNGTAAVRFLGNSNRLTSATGGARLTTARRKSAILSSTTEPDAIPSNRFTLVSADALPFTEAGSGEPNAAKACGQTPDRRDSDNSYPTVRTVRNGSQSTLSRRTPRLTLRVGEEESRCKPAAQAKPSTGTTESGALSPPAARQAHAAMQHHIGFTPGNRGATVRLRR
jgi:hypothetical protein